MAYLDRYTKSSPDDARGWYWLAQAQLYAKEFDAAKIAAGRAIALDGNSAESFRTLGEIELELKNHDAAYRAWIKSNQLDPHDPRTTYYLGRLFFEADFYNEAAVWLRQTLKAAPTHFAAMTYLGLCAERLEMPKTASDLYQAAIRESKNQRKPFPWAFLSYAKFLREEGNEREALAVLEEAEKLCPSAESLSLLGQMLAKDAPERAEALLRRAVEMNPGLPDAHYRLGLLLRARGQVSDAQAELRKFEDTKAAEERNKAKIQAIRKEP
jgi:tetratricopeptide (TPR) repeat protein